MKLTEHHVRQAILGLKSQSYQKSHNENRCMYRGFFGMRCALGWCIDDDHYHEKLEGQLPEDDDLAFLCAGDVQMWSTLQICHDRSESPDEMRSRLRIFCDEYFPSLTPLI